ncbi:MAG: hypothetical protein EA353_06815 [Puniceicoccaceae bacterium]|nr:MAG: hypothetical protein EA353_06815 [Puniceicoccaceae bacterium]
MKTLFDGRLYPVTSCIGFIEFPLDELVDFFVHWRKSLSPAILVKKRKPQGALVQALKKLEPLREFKTKYIFVPTHSRWTAVFDNTFRGADIAGDVMHASNVLSCGGVRVVADPGLGQCHYACIFETFGPLQPKQHLNYLRTIALTHDGEHWSFDQSGAPYEFEDVVQYGRRMKRERFSFDLLDQYLQHFQIRAFDEGFYLAEKSVIVELFSVSDLFSRKYSIEEVQRVAGVSF